MNSAERIKELCKRRKTPISVVERECGFSNGYLASLKRDLAGDKLFAVADFFGVSARWLVTGETTTDDFTDGEKDIIKKYRSLDENGKKTVTYILENEIRRIEENAEKTANIVPLWVSRQPASAGRGVYLSADEFDSILVEKAKETQAAAFAVPVCGDSMSPLFNDGDIILVSREKTLNKGDFGVFTINGCGYVKKLGDGALVSLNSEYADIPLNEETICNGKVIGILDKEMILQ